ncbi:MAG: 16S rRNA (cytosine(967)-C(5))-methyltransferase RsmB [Desulfovibrionaceae bacterium]|jgi:16S rRNA (cytosine967-C5)-methyltransferase|nr:16S rRNA (cytosine(967)-C(5))-methyltransferase RsmB [Desulfovibrionaceae bacterium]
MSALPRPQPPLWRQLQWAARMVHGVRQGRSLTAQLPRVDAALRPGVQALTFHALRWLGLAEALRARLAARAPAPRLDALLCAALSLLAADGPPGYAPFTLVDQAVEAAKRDAATRAGAALLNACLRRFLRERDALLRGLAEADLVARWNHPRWWIERLRADHPAAWMDVLAAAQQPAPMVLRVNALRASAQAYCQRLAAAGIEAVALGGHAVRLLQPRPVQALPGFEAGDVSVQSAAAQMAVPLLLDGISAAAPRILDACAAPGGKTAHVLELSPRARVTALEIDPERSPLIDGNLKRLGLQADVRVADAANTGAWRRGGDGFYDAILLDAPCSASGIVRRHPDVRWLRRAADIGQLAARQDRLLTALWPLLAPGGRLLYCTCSVFRAEGDERIQAFVAHNSNAALLPSLGHLLPGMDGGGGGLGDNGGCDDGFFYALLEKQSG